MAIELLNATDVLHMSPLKSIDALNRSQLLFFHSFMTIIALVTSFQVTPTILNIKRFHSTLFVHEPYTTFSKSEMRDSKLSSFPSSLLIHWKYVTPASSYYEIPIYNTVNTNPPGNLFFFLHYRGEEVEGFSSQFRHIELQGALAAVMNIPFDEVSLAFQNALNYTGKTLTSKPQKHVERFNNALQYIRNPEYPRNAFVHAVERCSLVHTIYEVLAEGETFEQLSDIAMKQELFSDMRRGGENENATWCVRVRHFGESSGAKQDLLRYGGRTRSVSKEKEACLALMPVLMQFGGKVNLDQPNVEIYLFDGFFQDKGRMVLARRLVDGPQISIIDPNTRICITNTPLVPIAAFTLCNVACLQPNATILDPYAGSGTILLAASMIEPSCRSVGIEIAHDGLVNRDHIRQDFAVRQLQQPLGLLLGDCTDPAMRMEAKALIGGFAFDCIVTDPPYGIRESTSEMDPMKCLLDSIIHDREMGVPLLKKDGLLVCFVPCSDEQAIEDMLPDKAHLKRAQLRLSSIREQPLNKKLSRWLVSYVCYG